MLGQQIEPGREVTDEIMVVQPVADQDVGPCQWERDIGSRLDL